MPDIGSTLGGIFGGGNGGGGGLGGILPLILGGAGLAGNIAAGNKTSGEFNWLQNYQKYLSNISPAQLSQMISQLIQPLNAGLTQSVGNNVSGYLAERGLSEAPGIQAATLSQALAPYY